MNLTKEQCNQLKFISKRIYGVSSYWRNKLVDKGVAKSKEEKALDTKGSSVNYLLTFEALRDYMLNVEEMRNKLLEEMKATNAAKDKEQPV